MKLPAYHLRIISDTEADVFEVSVNDNRRIKWNLCARFSIKSGEITMQNNAPAPQGLRDYCKSWQACIARSRDGGGAAYRALKAMGELATEAGNLDTPIDGELFEILIWSEANLKDALISNKGLAMLNENDQEKYILQGQHYMSEGKFDLAEAQYRRALEQQGNRANLHNFLAISLARQGKAKEAADAINQSISASTSSTRFLVRGAQYNLEAGNLDKARTYIKKLAKLENTPAGPMLQVSRLAMRADMKPLARELAEAIVTRNKDHEPALEHLVNIVAGTEGEAAVFKIIRRYVSTMPETPRLKEWYVRALIARGELDKAHQVTKNWIAQDGQSFQARFQLGRVYLALEKPRSAARALAAADRLSPDHAPTQKLIADACILLGDLEGAAAASGKACKIDPGNTNFKNQAKHITDLILAQSKAENQKPADTEAKQAPPKQGKK